MTNSQVQDMINQLNAGSSVMVACPTKPKAKVIQKQFKKLTKHKVVVTSVVNAEAEGTKHDVPVAVIAYIS